MKIAIIGQPKNQPQKNTVHQLNQPSSPRYVVIGMKLSIMLPTPDVAIEDEVRWTEDKDVDHQCHC